MKARHIFFLSVGGVTLLMMIIAAAGVFMLKETVIVLAFDAEPPDSYTISIVQNVLDERIKAFGSGLDVRSGKVEYFDERFVVTLRGHKDLSDFTEILLKRNRIYLHLAADDEAHERFEETGQLPKGFERHMVLHELIKLGSWGDTHKEEETILLRKQPEMDISRLKAVHMARNGWFRVPVITIEFDDSQADRFAQLTREHKGERLALSIEGEVFAAPEIQDEISNGIVQIKNIIYVPKAVRLYNLLRIGALPAELKVVEVRAPGREGSALPDVARNPSPTTK